jgi:hypothetical protein
LALNTAREEIPGFFVAVARRGVLALALLLRVRAVRSEQFVNNNVMIFNPLAAQVHTAMTERQ